MNKWPAYILTAVISCFAGVGFIYVVTTHIPAYMRERDFNAFLHGYSEVKPALDCLEDEVKVNEVKDFLYKSTNAMVYSYGIEFQLLVPRLNKVKYGEKPNDCKLALENLEAGLKELEDLYTRLDKPVIETDAAH